MRGTRQRERRLRKFVFFLGLVMLVMTVMVERISTSTFAPPDMWKVAVGTAAVGVLLILMSVIARPIPKVTWRAWLAGRWHGRHARRAAVNESGYKSARAKRSATNKAAWAAQRARDGRAAAAPHSRKSEKLNAEMKADRQRRALESPGAEWWSAAQRVD